MQIGLKRRDIVSRIKAAFPHIDCLPDKFTQAARPLDRLDERLLARASRGELIPQKSANEPARILLARLRKTRSAVPAAKRGVRPKGAA
jgi:type I restriction enzyme S subunit